MRTLLPRWGPVRLAGAAIAALVACSGDRLGPTEVASVSVEPATATVPLGGTRQLSARAFDAEGGEISGLQFTWSSSYSDIIGVSASGLVTAQSAGAATISASTGGQTGSAVIASSQPVTSVAVAPSPLALSVGESAQLLALLADPQGAPLAGRAVTWRSDDEAVATVSSSGLLTGLAPGTITISATSEGKTGTAILTVTATPVPVSSVTVEPSALSVAPGGSAQLVAVARDAAGNVLPWRPIVWNSSSPAIATVSSSGLVIGVAEGEATITATSEGVDGTAQVVVSAASAVASITISPGNAAVAAGGELQLAATARDAAGNPLIAHVFTWLSSSPGIAAASQAGVVTGVQIGGPVTITAAAEGVSGTASITVIPTPVITVALSPSPATFGVGGQLRLLAELRDQAGNPLTDRLIVWSTSNPSVVTVSGENVNGTSLVGVAVGAGVGSATITATADGVSDTAQVTVTTLHFTSISVGSHMACGLTPAGAAFCWGGGGLGTGDFTAQVGPVSVAGGHSFNQVTVGGQHACGVATSGVVYCWGTNSSGELGAGDTQSPPAPVPVSGGLTFATVSAGLRHTCGLLTDGKAYCWGDNGDTQLGATTTTTCSDRPCSPVPLAVAGGLEFSGLSAGLVHTCAVSLDQAAYCWGNNSRGQTGSGEIGGFAQAPIAVVGGLAFASVAAGSLHTCGVAVGGPGFCWGDNGYGELGNGASNTIEDTPTPVFGGTAFIGISAGARVSCGWTSTGAGYCWGQNAQGTLGTGDFFDSLIPAAIVGGLAFTSISVGSNLVTCGVTNSQTAYCWGRNVGGLTGTGSSVAYIPTPTRVAGQP